MSGKIMTGSGEIREISGQQSVSSGWLSVLGEQLSVEKLFSTKHMGSGKLCRGARSRWGLASCTAQHEALGDWHLVLRSTKHMGTGILCRAARSTWGLASCVAKPTQACLSPCAALYVYNK